MALWPPLNSGMLVRTGHTVLTWGITLVLFLHDTGEPDTAPPRAHPITRGSPHAWVYRGPPNLRHIEISISISHQFLKRLSHMSVQGPSSLRLIPKLDPN